jgi:hypothetical protein
MATLEEGAMESRRRSVSGTPGFFGKALPSKKIKEFKTGETIISQGEDCTDVHYIEKGVVHASRAMPSTPHRRLR